MKNYGLSKRLKSILAVLLCFALLSNAFGVIALAGGDHEHNFVGGLCTYCGKTRCQVNGHDYVDGACTFCGKLDPDFIVPTDCPPHNFINGVCTYCGKTWCEVNGHDYEDGVCTICGALDTGAIAPAECQHNFVDGVCTICGALDTGAIAPAGCPPHNFVNGVCTGCGLYVCDYTGNHTFENYVCTVCGKTECEYFGNHIFENNVCTFCGKYECEVTGRHQYVDEICRFCGKIYPYINCQHNFVNGKCTICGTVDDNAGGAEENCQHNFQNGVCTLCGAEDPNSSPSIGTCTHNFVGGVCTICGALDTGAIAPAGCPPHNFVNGVCTGCGIYVCEYTGYHTFENNVCTYCGKTWCEVNGHDYEEKEYDVGDCLHQGHRLSQCTICGDLNWEEFDGKHHFKYGRCTICGISDCEVYGHDFVNGVCQYCEMTWCETNNGGHQYENGVCSACGALEAELVAHNLSLEGDIGVNFYVTVNGATEDTYAEFTFKGETTQVPVDLDVYEDYNGDKAYRFTFDVAAADIGERIACVVVNGPYRSTARTYSVNQYIDETAVLDNDELRDLMGALADYGYYANHFFNPDSHSGKAIMSNYESKMDLMTAESLARFNGADFSFGAGNALTYEGMTLVLRSETAIRYYFTLPEGADTGDYTFKSVAPDDSETQLTPVKKGSMYYVEISDIPSALLGQMYIVQVYAGEELVNFFAGCALTYAYRVISAPEGMSEALVTLCKALAYYEDCAYRYFTD